MSSRFILGIDIAKETFQVTLLTPAGPRRRSFSNKPAGFQALRSWLRQHGVTTLQACLEATGRYGEDLADYLHAEGYTVSVVNPAQIKAYGQSQLRRNKTDRVDADLIADFCRTQEPAPWTPPSPEIRELRALLRQYEAVQEMRTQELNRLHSGSPSETVHQMLKEHVAFLEAQLKQLEDRMRDHLEQYPGLKQEHELLDSIPGIGFLTAAVLVGEDLTRFDDAAAVVAFAGLNPRQRSSGQYRGTSRLSKMGRGGLRRSLYFPALSALRWNEPIRALQQRLLERGKHKMQIIGAAMRKLLVIAYGVLKSGRSFDPQYGRKFEFAS